MDVTTIKDYAITARNQADRLHELIRRTGGLHVGPALGMEEVGVLLRGIDAERVLQLCSIIEKQQTRITELEVQLPTPA